MVLFSGRVPVNTYRGFPGPGPQYKSCQHRLGISSLSCWVGPVDSPSPVCSKSLNVVWTVLHEMLRFRAIFLNESSIAIHCQTTLQRRSGKYADLCPGSADIVIVLVFTIFEPTAFSREAYPGFPLNHLVSLHRKQVMNLVTTYALTLCRVRTELKSTVIFLFENSHLHVYCF